MSTLKKILLVLNPLYCIALIVSLALAMTAFLMSVLPFCHLPADDLLYAQHGWPQIVLAIGAMAGYGILLHRHDHGPKQETPK